MKIILTSVFISVLSLNYSNLVDAQEKKADSKIKIQDKLTEMNVRLKNEKVDKNTKTNDSTKEKDLFDDIDFAKLKNPFQSQLPVPEKPKPESNPSGPASKGKTDSITSNPDDPAGSRRNQHPEPEPPPITPPKLNIQGIIWSSTRPQAIVNNEVVDVGNILEDDVKVLQIHKQGIEVLYKEKKFTINPPKQDEVSDPASR